jgi:hypothetical protein
VLLCTTEHLEVSQAKTTRSGSSVGIVSGYGLDDCAIEVRSREKIERMRCGTRAHLSLTRFCSFIVMMNQRNTRETEALRRLICYKYAYFPEGHGH